MFRINRMNFCWLTFAVVAASLRADTGALAAVIRVPDDFATIQDAVDAAINGDRIEVSSVTSEENVQIVDKALEIVAVVTPVVVGSFSWTNPSGSAAPAGGLLTGFHVTGDVTAHGMSLSFTASQLTVDGGIAFSTELPPLPFAFDVVDCTVGAGIFVDADNDEDGGEARVSGCTALAGEVHLRGLDLSVIDCQAQGILCEGNSSSHVEGSRCNGALVIYGDLTALATGNVVVDGAMVIVARGQARAFQNVIHNGEIRLFGGENLCIGNQCFDGGGIETSGFAVYIAENLIVRGDTAITGPGTNADASIQSNTIVDCSAGIIVWESNGDISQNIVVGCELGIRLNPSTFAGCNDVWGNAQNWGNFPDQEGRNGNISVNPMFCDSQLGDYSLARTSACLPGNHPDGFDCETIGAFGEGCTGPVPVVEASWGGVKAHFRK